ncbi:ABC transporter substrate-binding protein [Vibrio rumoiensis]|uniref:ABC transporter substrate-binding protein n=1 Tax=Vibrio rumoiensis 1S-45 TaxID=1188252 RepID=A0A1E5DYF7_9VIBR|nr:ABC transporter substrate-binding protein [Vibrio rumoiensis]OEF22649.1 ABC transporter substrate-binding protein [Vibrio rumoiensis 1S-45]
MFNFKKKMLLSAVGSFVAFSSLFSLNAVAQDKEITVGALRFTSHAATFVAVERGYFKQQGLDVKLKFFQAAQPMAVAVASKDVDYAVTAMSGGLISLADKGAIKIIGGSLSEDPNVDGQKIVVSNKAFESGVTDPSKLDGKTWAISQQGSSFHYVGSQIEQQEGVNLKFKPLQKVGAIIGALKSGQVDAWSIVPHIAKPLADSGAIHVIGNVSDYLPHYQVTTIFTSTTNAEQERAQTQAFLTALAKGAADYNAAMIDKTAGQQGQDDMVKLIHKYVYTDRPLEKAAPSIINGAMRLNKGNFLNMASLQNQLDWFQQGKMVKSSIKLSDVVDSSYVETNNTEEKAK